MASPRGGSPRHASPSPGRASLYAYTSPFASRPPVDGRYYSTSKSAGVAASRTDYSAGGRTPTPRSGSRLGAVESPVGKKLYAEQQDAIDALRAEKDRIEESAFARTHLLERECATLQQTLDTALARIDELVAEKQAILAENRELRARSASINTSAAHATGSTTADQSVVDALATKPTEMMRVSQLLDSTAAELERTARDNDRVYDLLNATASELEASTRANTELKVRLARQDQDFQQSMMQTNDDRVRQLRAELRRAEAELVKESNESHAVIRGLKAKVRRLEAENAEFLAILETLPSLRLSIETIKREQDDRVYDLHNSVYGRSTFGSSPDALFRHSRALGQADDDDKDAVIATLNAELDRMKGMLDGILRDLPRDFEQALRTP